MRWWSVDSFEYRAHPDTPVAIEPEKKETRPPPWEGLDAKRSGRILLGLAIASGAMFLFVGYLYFLMIANPTVSEMTLYNPRPFEAYNPSIEDLDLYLQLSGLYVLCSFLAGLWLSLSVKAVKVERFGRVQLFTMLTPVLFLLPGMVLPVAREILLFMPPVMFLYSASLLVHPENRHRQRLVQLGVLAIVPMVLGEGFLVAAKPAGAATMYLFMLVLGFSAIGLILLSREEHLKRLREEAERRSSLDPGRTLPYQPPREALPDERPAQPPAARAGPRPAYLVATIGAVLFIAFLPPLWVLDTGPDLEIYWQIRNDVDGDPQRAELHVRAMVINRGAEAAVGLIELTVSYNLTRIPGINGTPNIAVYPLAECGRMDGFGSWYVEVNITVNNWNRGNQRPMITLSFNGREIETQRIRVPAPNPLLALAAVMVLKVLSDRWKGRRRH